MKLGTIAAFGMLMLAAPAFAHHPFDSEFDAKKPVTLTGKVTAVEWMGPHVIIQVEAMDKGQMKKWDLEAASPEEMTTMGWTKDTLKMGEQITVHGFGAKAPTSMTVAARSFDLPGGKKMSSAGNDGGPKA